MGLKRLCVLKYNAGSATLEVYKSRKYGLWHSKKGLNDNLSKITPCRILTLVEPDKGDITKIIADKRSSTKTGWSKTINEGDKWSKNQIIVKGTTVRKYRTHKDTPSQVWVLNVYDNMESNRTSNRMMVEEVCDALHAAKPSLLSKEDAEQLKNKDNKDIVRANRRRLSPCENFLKDLRSVRPYRDSPVLTRLLGEIREANNQDD